MVQSGELVTGPAGLAGTDEELVHGWRTGVAVGLGVPAFRLDAAPPPPPPEEHAATVSTATAASPHHRPPTRVRLTIRDLAVQLTGGQTAPSDDPGHRGRV